MDQSGVLCCTQHLHAVSALLLLLWLSELVWVGPLDMLEYGTSSFISFFHSVHAFVINPSVSTNSLHASCVPVALSHKSPLLLPAQNHAVLCFSIAPVISCEEYRPAIITFSPLYLPYAAGSCSFHLSCISVLPTPQIAVLIVSCACMNWPDSLITLST